MESDGIQIWIRTLSHPCLHVMSCIRPIGLVEMLLYISDVIRLVIMFCMDTF